MREQSRYARIEKRLRSYREDCARLAVLNDWIDELKREDLPHLRTEVKSDYSAEDAAAKYLSDRKSTLIEAAALAPPLGKEGNGGGLPSSPTERIALADGYGDKTLLDLYAAEAERDRLAAMVHQLENAMAGLDDDERIVIEYRYIRKRGWHTISAEYTKEFGIVPSERTMRRLCRSGIERMDAILQGCVA